MSEHKGSSGLIAKLPEETVEFFEPREGLELSTYLAKEDKQGIHHLARYHWAKQVLTSAQFRSILDIACGAGFGSYILARALPGVRVVGADYDLRAIETARRSYKADNLSFVQGNIVTWERDHNGKTDRLGRYDAVVSFDTIEHLIHREIALLRIVENLPEHGRLLLSTPCHRESILHPGWEHHKIEYSFSDLQNLLRRFFERVLIPENGTLPLKSFWDEVVNREKQRYWNRMNPVVCEGPIQF